MRTWPIVSTMLGIFAACLVVYAIYLRLTASWPAWLLVLIEPDPEGWRKFGCTLAMFALAFLCGCIAIVFWPRDRSENIGLHRISPREKNGKIDIVFVHGLCGDRYETWTYRDRITEFRWPRELDEELPDAVVWSFGYETSIHEWDMHTSFLHDKANSFLAELNANRIGQRKTIFICHSMGGLVTKAAIRYDVEGKGGERLTEIPFLAPNVAGIVFVATPHKGTKLADVLLNFAFLLGRSKDLVALAHHSNHLWELHLWFLVWLKGRNDDQLAPAITSFRESQPLRLSRFGRVGRVQLIVTEESAGIGWPGGGLFPFPAAAIRVEASDHVQIAKPTNKQSIVFRLTNILILKVLNRP